MKLIAIDTTKTITKGFPYYATKETDGRVKIMNDVGTILWMKKLHFVESVE